MKFHFVFFLSSNISSKSSSLSLSSKNSIAHCLGNHPRILLLLIVVSLVFWFFVPFSPFLVEPFVNGSWIFSPKSQCRLHRVTFTKSPVSRGMRDSSVRGGWIQTLKPCDHKGIQLPETFVTIRYRRVLARFSTFWYSCSRWKKKNFSSTFKNNY